MVTDEPRNSTVLGREGSSVEAEKLFPRAIDVIYTVADERGFGGDGASDCAP
jgi:hypothetical protein